MIDNNDFSENTHFTLSYELLCLLRWLAAHDAEKLKRIVSRALAGGLHEELKKEQRGSADNLLELDGDIQHSIVEFLDFRRGTGSFSLC